MLSYNLHRLPVAKDSNCSVEDGVDNNRPADLSIYLYYRRLINA